jgi:hypothetical protein
MNHATAGRATLTRPARRQAGDPAIRADPAARRSTRARDGSPGSGCRRLESVDQVRGDREAAGLELVWKTLSGSRYRISVRQAQNDRQAGRASADRPGRGRRADAVSGPVGHALEYLCELVQVDAFEVAEQVAAGAGVVTGLSLFQAASPASVGTALKERASRGSCWRRTRPSASSRRTVRPMAEADCRQLPARSPRRMERPARARTASRTRRSGRQHNHSAIFRTASSAIPAAILKSLTPK